MKEALFKPIEPEKAMENFVKAIKGEEEIDDSNELIVHLFDCQNN